MTQKVWKINSESMTVMEQYKISQSTSYRPMLAMADSSAIYPCHIPLLNSYYIIECSFANSGKILKDEKIVAALVLGRI